MRACEASSLIRSGWKMVMPRSRASRLVADWSTFSPRPAGRSGWVTRSCTAWPASTNPSSVGTAKAAVPAKTIRTAGPELPGLGPDELRLFLLFLRFDFAQGLEAGQAVGEQDPVDVVDFVLDGASQQRVTFDLHHLAVAVEPTGHHLHVACDLADVAGD